MNKYKEMIETIFNPLQKIIVEKLTVVQKELEEDPDQEDRKKQEQELNVIMKELLVQGEEFASLLPEFVSSEMPGQDAGETDKAKKEIEEKLAKIGAQGKVLLESVKKIEV